MYQKIKIYFNNIKNMKKRLILIWVLILSLSWLFIENSFALVKSASVKIWWNLTGLNSLWKDEDVYVTIWWWTEAAVASWAQIALNSKTLDEFFSQAASMITNAHWWESSRVSESSTSVACVNGWFDVECVWDCRKTNTTSILWSTSSTSITAPTPLERKTESYNWCGEYISSWTTNRSDCSITGNWSSNGTISCQQTPSYTENKSNWGTMYCDVFYKNGNIIKMDNCTSCQNLPSDVAKPTEWVITNTVIASLNETNSKCFDLYANDSDICNLSFNVSASTKQWKWITWWWNNWKIYSITDTSWEKSDRIAKTWNALNFSSVNSTWIPSSTSNSFSVKINDIKSRSPFYSNSWSMTINLGWVQMNLTNIYYNFLKPFIWKLLVSNDSWETWNASPTLWTKQLYQLSATKSNINQDTYTLNLDTGSISTVWSGIQLQDTELESYDGQWAYKFMTRINSSADATELNDNPWIQVKDPIISYNLNWILVKYYLSRYETWNDLTPIELIWSTFNWLRVIWWIQSDWKSEFIWQWKNISSLLTSTFRDEIRKNAYTYIAQMKSGQILNSVKYVEWDTIISWTQDYETLVVKDWNVIISWDLNISKKKLGIIVLKDNYDVNSDYTNKWNVYVEPSVTNINAIIYADWWVISTDSNWTPFTTDSLSRTKALQNQLIVNWSFFTRNTIWWAQYVWWYYLLPGWSKTSDFNKAMIYDLNYLRTWNKWCDLNWDWDCSDSSIWEYKEWTILKYDSTVQTDPPKLFY